MQIDLYTASGKKQGTLDVPAALFEAPINRGLMHLALVRQLSNRRHPIAHVKHRGEVVGSTKKMYQQKHTGRARRGPVRSPLLRGGGKAFGPRNDANFIKDMPKKMRRAALFSCLSYRAKQGAILGLEDYPQDQYKTKQFVDLLQKLPVQHGRRIVVVTGTGHAALERSARNVPGVTVLRASYLNPVDLLSAKSIVFLQDAVTAAERIFVTGAADVPSVAQETEVPKAPAKKKPRTSAKASTSSKKSSTQKKASA